MATLIIHSSRNGALIYFMLNNPPCLLCTTYRFTSCRLTFIQTTIRFKQLVAQSNTIYPPSKTYCRQQCQKSNLTNSHAEHKTPPMNIER